MPGGDRTGPAGMGPMTGRAAGYCAGYEVPGFMNAVPGGGRGMAWGRGGGFGRGLGLGFRGGRRWAAPYGYPAPYAAAPAPQAAYGAGPSTQQELDMLKEQADYLQNNLEGVRERIQELEKNQSGE